MREFRGHDDTADLLDWSITARSFRSRVIQSELTSSDRNALQLRPLRFGRRVTRVSTTMSLSDPRPAPVARLCIPARSCKPALTRCRVSQVPDKAFRTRCPLFIPEGSSCASARCFHDDCRLHLSWTTGRLQKCNETDWGSLSLRLTRSPRRGFVPSIAADRRSPGLLSNGLVQCQDFP